MPSCLILFQSTLGRPVGTSSLPSSTPSSRANDRPVRPLPTRQPTSLRSFFSSTISYLNPYSSTTRPAETKADVAKAHLASANPNHLSTHTPNPSPSWLSRSPATSSLAAGGVQTENPASRQTNSKPLPNLAPRRSYIPDVNDWPRAVSVADSSISKLTLSRGRTLLMDKTGTLKSDVRPRAGSPPPVVPQTASPAGVSTTPTQTTEARSSDAKTRRGRQTESNLRQRVQRKVRVWVSREGLTRRCSMEAG